LGDLAPVSGERPATTLVVAGPVTLGEVPRWREALIAAFSEAKPVQIDLAASGPWDVAGLQLLISALATGRRSGQPVRLVHVPRGFTAIAEQAGVSGRLAEAVGDQLN
jgi:ABC-type transporter Mla MlaB component